MSDLLGIIDRLREAAAAMLVPIDHRSHENSSWPSSECDDCMSIRKVRADRLRAALASTPSAPTLDVNRDVLAGVLFGLGYDNPGRRANEITRAYLRALAVRLHETPQPEPRSPSRRAPK